MEKYRETVLRITLNKPMKFLELKRNEQVEFNCDFDQTFENAVKTNNNVKIKKNVKENLKDTYTEFYKRERDIINQKEYSNISPLLKQLTDIKKDRITNKNPTIKEKYMQLLEEHKQILTSRIESQLTNTKLSVKDISEDNYNKLNNLHTAKMITYNDIYIQLRELFVSKCRVCTTYDKIERIIEQLSLYDTIFIATTKLQELRMKSKDNEDNEQLGWSPENEVGVQEQVKKPSEQKEQLTLPSKNESEDLAANLPRVDPIKWAQIFDKLAGFYYNVPTTKLGKIVEFKKLYTELQNTINENITKYKTQQTTLLEDEINKLRFTEFKLDASHHGNKHLGAFKKITKLKNAVLAKPSNIFIEEINKSKIVKVFNNVLYSIINIIKEYKNKYYKIKQKLKLIESTTLDALIKTIPVATIPDSSYDLQRVFYKINHNQGITLPVCNGTCINVNEVKSRERIINYMTALQNRSIKKKFESLTEKDELIKRLTEIRQLSNNVTNLDDIYKCIEYYEIIHVMIKIADDIIPYILQANPLTNGDAESNSLTIKQNLNRYNVIYENAQSQTSYTNTDVDNKLNIIYDTNIVEKDEEEKNIYKNYYKREILIDEQLDIYKIGTNVNLILNTNYIKHKSRVNYRENYERFESNIKKINLPDKTCKPSRKLYENYNTTYVMKMEAYKNKYNELIDIFVSTCLLCDKNNMSSMLTDQWLKDQWKELGKAMYKIGKLRIKYGIDYNDECKKPWRGGAKPNSKYYQMKYMKYKSLYMKYKSS